MTSGEYTPGWKLALVSAIAGKIIVEQTGVYDVTTLGADIGGRVAIDAHLYGFSGGVFLYFSEHTFNRLRQLAVKKLANTVQ